MKRAWFVVLVLAGMVAGLAHAQAPYPNRPVKIVVPFSPGTAADITARQLAQRLSEIWGQGVVIENQAGAGGNIGAAQVAKSAPDGYTLVMFGINHVINPSLYKETGYDPIKDFKPIARVGVAPLAIIANNKFPPNTIGELVAYAKANPGAVSYGSGGNGSVTHLSLELIKMQTGIRMTHVPYKSIAPMLTDILGDQIPIGSPALASALPHVKAGTMKVLAVTTARRSSVLPNVPTVAESGLAGYDVGTWNGLLAPAATPDAIVDKIYADVVKVSRNKAFIEPLQSQALDVDVQSPAEFKAYLASELDKWSKLVRESGAKLD